MRRWRGDGAVVARLAVGGGSFIRFYLLRYSPFLTLAITGFLSVGLLLPLVLLIAVAERGGSAVLFV